MRQKGIVFIPVVIIVVLLGVVGYFAYQNSQLRKNDITPTNNPIVIPTTNLPNPTTTPSPCKKVGEPICINPLICPNNNDKCCEGLVAVIATKSNAICQTSTETNSSKLTTTPTTRSFEEEEKLMRRTLAGFEMYIGARNTAGALSFFTPPQTNSAKEKYESIRAKNLPTGLKSWDFVEDTYGKLAVEGLKGGYRVRINECKINSNSCSLLFLELVRDGSAENGFSVDRYYTGAYAYQNNLGEEIKYQGFGL